MSAAHPECAGLQHCLRLPGHLHRTSAPRTATLQTQTCRDRGTKTPHAPHPASGSGCATSAYASRGWTATPARPPSSPAQPPGLPCQRIAAAPNTHSMLVLLRPGRGMMLQLKRHGQAPCKTTNLLCCLHFLMCKGQHSYAARQYMCAPTDSAQSISAARRYDDPSWIEQSCCCGRQAGPLPSTSWLPLQLQEALRSFAIINNFEDRVPFLKSIMLQ